jgi:hypothetical protein
MRSLFVVLLCARHAFGFQSLKSVRNPVAGIVSLYAESRDENAKGYEFALLFDCDGVILETEELHRLAYNAAFKEFDLTIDGEPVVWSVRASTEETTPAMNDCLRCKDFRFSL